MLPCPPSPGLGALGALPSEILQHILFLLVAQTPLGPPSALNPVRLTSRALAVAASDSALLMRVFRLTFDAGAVVRRLFRPQAQDMAAQLVWSCRVLKSLRRGLPDAEPEPGEEAGDARDDGTRFGLDEEGDGDAMSRLEEPRRRKEAERDVDMGPEDTLLGALLLMLDNDGRNYAQLDHAGVHEYVAAYISRRLWHGSRDNAGWPVEDVAGACALWVMWLTTDRERLMAETPLERENVVLSILPFVFLIHRYPASEAPPNHFHLPLRDTSAAVSKALPHAPRTAFYPELSYGFASSSGSGSDEDEADARSGLDSEPSTSSERASSTHSHSPLPTYTRTRIPAPQHYPHYLPPRALTTPYFGALPQLAPPLASVAAKLLFVARREVRPFGIPQHLPRDREDAVRRWWGNQVETARAIQAQQAAAAAAAQNPAQAPLGQHQAPPQPPAPLLAQPIPPMPAHIQPPQNLGPTQADYRALNRGKAAALPRGARWDWDAGCARAVNRDVGEDGLDADAVIVARRRSGKGEVEVEVEESRRWDPLWWRMRLCSDFRAQQPRHAPGAVFERGCMKGMWQGKIYIPQGNSLMQLIGQNPEYPGIPDAHGLFSEASLGIIMQPVFLEMEEHVRVCGCKKPTAKQSSSSQRTRRSLREETPTEEDVGEQPHAEHQHQHEACGVIPVPPLSGIADWRGVPFAGVLPADLPAGHPQHGPPPPLAVNNINNAGGDDFDSTVMAPDLRLPPQPLDYSMSNAWLPGGIGDLAYESRPAAGGPPLVVRQKEGGGFVPVDVDEDEEDRIRRRDELVVSTTGRAPDVLRAQGACKAFAPHPTTSTTAATPHPAPDDVPEEGYVYETYDPARVSVHDVRYEPAPYIGPSHHWPAEDGAVVGIVDLAALEEGAEVVNPQCAGCVEREAARRAERAKAERGARRALEGRAARAGVVAALDDACVHADADADADAVSDASLNVASERSPGKREIGAEGRGVEREPKRRRVDEQDAESTETATAAARAAEGQKQLVEMMRSWRRPGDSDSDVEMEGTVEELDLDGFGLSMDDEEDVDMEEIEEEERQNLEDEDDDDEEDDQISVLGDDLPFGQPGLWTSEPTSTTTAKRTYIPRTRREFARERITSIPTPCAHAADTLFTGHTPACGLAWGQRYTTYGRLRPWDGLVGLVRVGRNPVNFIFIFGYVVGGRTFVGEWRVAASDPMRPAWGAAFVMSRVGA